MNKTIAKFYYKGKHYEIDWLTDSDNIFRVYDLFGGKGQNAYHLHQWESKSRAKSFLIKEAKEAIKEYGISY